MRQSPQVFELVSAIVLSEKYLGTEVRVWSDVSPALKDRMGLPSIDVGIDILPMDVSWVGQAKKYDKTPYVPAKHIDRTRFCMYRAMKFGYDPRQTIITAPTGVKLGNPKVPTEDVELETISEETIERILRAACDYKEIEREIVANDMTISNMTHLQFLDDIHEEIPNIHVNVEETVINTSSDNDSQQFTLRPCQLAAIKSITSVKENNSVVRRIKMPPGAGKTQVAIESILQRHNDASNNNTSPNNYSRSVVFVPTILLQHQWVQALLEAGIAVRSIDSTVNIEETSRTNTGWSIVYVVVYMSWKVARKIGKVIITKSDDVYDSDELRDDESVSDEDNEVITFDSDDESYDESHEIAGTTSSLSHYDFIFVDEAHHIEFSGGTVYGELWNALREYAGWSKINRSSNRVVYASASLGLLEEDNENRENSCGFDYEYTLREAIIDGVLTDYEVIVPFFDSEPTLKNVATFVSPDDRFGSVLCYCNTIDNAKLLAKEFKIMDVTVEAIYGEQSLEERTKLMDAFRRGDIRVLVSVNVLAEGLNLIEADTVVFAEPRKSPKALLQAAGRAMRLYKGKLLARIVYPSCIVEGELTRDRPVVGLLRVLSEEDSEFVKKSRDGRRVEKTSRVSYVDGERTKEGKKDGEFVREEVWRSDVSKIYQDYSSFRERVKPLIDFWEENGRLPTRSKVLRNEEYKVSVLLNNLRNDLRNKKLTQQDVYYLNDVIPIWAQRRTFSERIAQLVAFYNHHKRLPIQRETYGIVDHKVGSLLNELKHTYHTLKEADLIYLDTMLPGWNNKKTFQKRVQSLLLFYTEKGRLPRFSEGYEPNGINVGYLLNSLKTDYRLGKLSNAEISYMTEHLPRWNVIKKLTPMSNDKARERLEKQIKALVDSYNKNGVLPKLSKDPETKTKLWNLRKSYKEKAVWTTSENITYLDRVLPGWREGLD